MKIVAVQFDQPSKLHFYDAGELELNLGDTVVVSDEGGQQLGKISLLNVVDSKKFISKNLPPIVRKAIESDYTQTKRNQRRQLDAFAICQRMIRQMNLPMKVVKAQFTLGGGKVSYYFSSENRIDYRHLVEHLTQELGMKVEMNQIGVRDATGMLGGIGICGREYCCSTFLTSFKPISIKMAKVQNLSLNPEKVSGGCGRLRCCLQYELDLYHELGKGIPKVGKNVMTTKGPGRVRNVEILKRQLLVDLGAELGDQWLRPEDIKMDKQSQPEIDEDDNTVDDKAE